MDRPCGMQKGCDRRRTLQCFQTNCYYAALHIVVIRLHKGWNLRHLLEIMATSGGSGEIANSGKPERYEWLIGDVCHCNASERKVFIGLCHTQDGC